MATEWMGPLPKTCEICHGTFGKVFYDANTRYGWANVCHSCFKTYGHGLGTGRGQKFDSKTGKKLEG